MKFQRSRDTGLAAGLATGLALALIAGCHASSPPAPQQAPARRAAESLAAPGRLIPAAGGWIRKRDLADLEAGGTRVDLDVLAGDELQKSESALFKCGPFWFDELDANDYHSRLLYWWKIPAEHFLAYSTCSRSTSLVALAWMEHTWPNLVRLFGVEPEGPLTVITLRSVLQYNAFNITQPGPGVVAPESAGWSAFHFAYLCEQWVDLEEGLFPGAGCGYWDDTTAAGNGWGPFSIRHAAAQAFVEAVDPSPGTGGAWLRDPTGEFPRDAFWSEKKLPLWLRYGAAVYCERYFTEPGAEDPTWARTWSNDELNALGGLDDLDTAFACELAQDEVTRSRKNILQAGLLVAFVLDGGNPAVREAHGELRRALAADEGVGPAVAALEAEIAAQEQALRAFARGSR